MNVILSNMLKLASDGAFNTQNQVQPMSHFKWRTLYRLSLKQDIAPYVAKGIEIHKDDALCNISEEDKELFKSASFTDIDDVSDKFILSDIESVNLSNPFKRFVLKEIVEKERHAIDTSIVSLDMLSVILQNINLTLRYGVRLRPIITLGHFLRTRGQSVDFVKIDGWLRRMKFHRMARFQASILNSFFGFEKNEFPYIKKCGEEDAIVCKSLMRDYTANKYGRTYDRNSISNCLRFYRYTRSESFFKMSANIKRSLSEIEE